MFYDSICAVYCPYFKEEVVFNAKGFEHIRFKRRNKAREEKDQYMRFRLIELAPRILAASHTLQGVLERKDFELERSHNRWDTILRNVSYYEFVAVLKEVRVRIVVKQVEGGPKYFWSIIPFWRINPETGRRLLHSGIPNEE